MTGKRFQLNGGIIQKELQRMLDFLRVKLGIGEKLHVVWMPDSSKDVLGEVKNGLVYIYAADREKAMGILKHEIIDYCITSKIINPLVRLVNLLIKSKAEEVYKAKETLVEIILNLGDDNHEILQSITSRNAKIHSNELNILKNDPKKV